MNIKKNSDILLFLEKIEEYLLKSDIHVDIVKKIIKTLFLDVNKKTNMTKYDIINNVSFQIQHMISKHIAVFDIDKKYKPYVMLVCGVNGVGKTTTVGKMSMLLKKYGWNIMIAECDTYHKNAKQQICDITGKKIESDIFTGKSSKDSPSKIAVDAYNKALKENKDILIIDTSGRMQNSKILMSELKKIKQKLNKISDNIPHDVVLIIDSCCGYSAIEQILTYIKLIGITGIIATKIDVINRPGIILSICEKFNIKIFGACYGKDIDKIDDLDPKKFTDLILNDFLELNVL